MVIRLPEIDFETFKISDVPSAPEPFRLANRIPILDNGEKLVDLRETNPEFSFADFCLPYVRESIAEGLQEATRRLPHHLDLRMYTALRTLEQQAEMYWSNYKKARENHPTWPESTVRRMTNRFFAPPDAKAPPGHCTGAAVDVGLHIRETGEGLDVRSPLDGWKGSPTAVDGLYPESAENRRLLCYLMHSTGLSNCRDEFWHWSFGDSAWAVRLGEPVACYGLIAPPEGATRVRGGKLALSDYDPAYPARFEEIRTALLATVGDLARRIDHVGSTAVLGLSGQPILDIVIEVESSQSLERLAELFGSVGYDPPNKSGSEGRAQPFRVKSGDEGKESASRSWCPHELYAFSKDSDELYQLIAFRDHLRSNSSAAGDYAELKRRLAERHPWDRTRYHLLKSPFIGGVLRDIGAVK